MTRVVSGAVLVVIAIAIVWVAPAWMFQAFAVLVIVLGVWELAALARAGALPLESGASLALGTAVFAAIYVALPIAALVWIRMQGGPMAVFLLMLTVMVSDTAQYYTGRAFGRRPLAPRISPKKTLEGAAGGFVFGTLLFVVVGKWWLPQLSAPIRALVGVAIVALGIAGDLFESLLKRRAGVKDSSALIPGHGGVLDRIDALLFAAPVYYVVLRYV